LLRDERDGSFYATGLYVRKRETEGFYIIDRRYKFTKDSFPKVSKVINTVRIVRRQGFEQV
jgi:3-phenylpropionate/cinnamic acid dioxygenase small subunit